MGQANSSPRPEILPACTQDLLRKPAPGQSWWTTPSVWAVLIIGLAIIPSVLILWSTNHIGCISDPHKPEASYYALSSEAQVLAAVLALSIGAVIASAALGTRYTWRTSNFVLGGWLAIYAGPYVVGIGLPLFLLHLDYHCGCTRVSYVVLVVCLVLLLPFILDLRSRLHVTGVVARLGKQARKEYRSPKKNGDKVSDDVEALVEIAHTAFAHRDFEVFRDATTQLGVVSAQVLHEAGQDARKPVEGITNELTELGREVYKSGLGPAIRVTHVLGQIGQCAIETQHFCVATWVARSLGSVGRAGAHMAWADGSMRVVDDLACMARKLADVGSQMTGDREEVLDRIVLSIVEIGAVILNNPPDASEETLNEVLSQLHVLRAWGLDIVSIVHVTEGKRPWHGALRTFSSRFDQLCRESVY